MAVIQTNGENPGRTWARKSWTRVGISVNRLSELVGTWLSLVERCVRDAEVAGSNPVVPTQKTFQKQHLPKFPRDIFMTEGLQLWNVVPRGKERILPAVRRYSRTVLT